MAACCHWQQAAAASTYDRELGGVHNESTPAGSSRELAGRGSGQMTCVTRGWFMCSQSRAGMQCVLQGIAGEAGKEKKRNTFARGAYMCGSIGAAGKKAFHRRTRVVLVQEAWEAAGRRAQVRRHHLIFTFIHGGCKGAGRGRHTAGNQHNISTTRQLLGGYPPLHPPHTQHSTAERSTPLAHHTGPSTTPPAGGWRPQPGSSRRPGRPHTTTGPLPGHRCSQCPAHMWRWVGGWAGGVQMVSSRAS